MTDKRPLLPHPTDPNLRIVVLANGRGLTTVDAKYEADVGRYSWRLDVRKRGCTNYAKTWGPRVNGRKTMWTLHQFIAKLAGFGDCEQVDHRNGDGLLNTEGNLRPSDGSENQSNGQLQPNNTSGFMGVHWHKRDKAWHASIQFRGNALYLGRFKDPATAALVRDTAALRYHGKFAVLNFPRSCPGTHDVPGYPWGPDPRD